MKKITALVALALLAIAGTGYAVTCAQDNVPAATLLVPYFRVGGAGIVGTGSSMGDIPDTSGTDTLVAVTNVSAANIIIHVTLWNKYSAPVLDFNVPMTPYDVVFWSMRDILNGKLIVNPTYQKLSSAGVDPCGQTGVASAAYALTKYLRFSAVDLSDRTRAISVYQTPAFSGTFRQNVWTSLDESGDITSWTSTGSVGSGVIDADNYACGSAAGNIVNGDFSGYVTIDVVNFCTLYFPNDQRYYGEEIIATTGWNTATNGWTPNVLMGDVFYKDQKPGDTSANMGNISGDPAVHLEFDSRLPWNALAANNNLTFYNRYVFADPTTGGYAFPGDGREPLGKSYGFRYMQTGATTSLRTWAIVYRSDIYPGDSSLEYPDTTALCSWWLYRVGISDPSVYSAVGFTDAIHRPNVIVFDNDENTVNVTGCPSPCGVTPGNIPLETQRLVITPNVPIVPSSFLGGWISMTLPGYFEDQAWVGVQHSGLGLAISVGHSATLLSGQFICNPSPFVTFAQPGITVQTGTAVQTNY
jgi:hypothetical protein